jgi:predicted Zn-dependent peptidase
LELRVSAEDLAAWQQQAASSPRASVANWIRDVLNREVRARQSSAEMQEPGRAEESALASTRLLRLPNGLRLLLRDVRGLPSIGFALAVDCGSREERESEHGHASLLSRQLLHSAGLASPGLEEVGGDAAVRTSPDYTLFSIIAPAHAGSAALHRLHRIVAPEDFSPVSVEAEKQTSLRQLDLRRHSAEDLLADALVEGCWQDHPLGHTPYGETTSLVAATGESLRSFFERHYHASRMILSVWGDFSRWDPAEEAGRLFGELAAGSPATPLVPARFRPFVDVLDWHGRHASLAIAVAAPTASGPYRWAFELWEPLLTEGMYSILWQKLWSRRSEVLRLSCRYETHREAGMLRIHTTSDESAVGWILDRVLTGLEEIVLAPENIPAGRVRYAQSVKTGMFPRIADVREQAAHLATGCLLTGEPVTPFEARNGIDAADNRLLHRGFREMLRPQTGNISVAIASPVRANADNWRKLVLERVQRRLVTGGGLPYRNAPWTM